MLRHAYNLAAIGDFKVSGIVVGDFSRAWIFLCVNFSPCPNRCDLMLSLLDATLRFIVRLQRRALQGLNFYIASAHGHTM